MTKTIKTICSLLVCALLVLTLASCSAQKKYEKYAEDIRVAAAKEEYKTYEEVVKKLGTPTVNLTGSLFGSGVSGLATWYADCANADELQAKLDAGKEVPYITVNFADGKAKDASTGVKAPESDK